MAQIRRRRPERSISSLRRQAHSSRRYIFCCYCCNTGWLAGFILSSYIHQIYGSCLLIVGSFTLGHGIAVFGSIIYITIEPLICEHW